MTGRRYSSLDRAIAISGSSRALASAVGVSAQALSQWKRVPAARVLDVERCTGVTRYDLRPDLYSSAAPSSCDGAVKRTTDISLSARIRARLDAVGLSASQASLNAGLGRSAVTDILAGNSESPRVVTVEALAPVLQCSTGFLVEGRADKSAPDGGAAFPLPAVHNQNGDQVEGALGMSLRAYAAVHALSGLAAAFGRPDRMPNETQAMADARWSVDRADALIAELGKAFP